MQTFPNIPDDTKIEEALAREVRKAIRELYLDVLKKESEIFNSGNPLESAIISGKVFFEDGYFKGEFNSSTSKLLKSMGAVWSKKGWKIAPEKLSTQYLSAIAQSKLKNTRDIERLLNNLMGVNPEKIASKADVKKIYDKAISNLNKGLDEQLGKVPMVSAQFDEFQLATIKEKYSENMRLHIRGWAEDEVLALRKKVWDNANNGIRYDAIIEEINKKYSASPKRALFIAKQETRLLTTEMKASKYQKGGIQKFVWHARHDDKVRQEHKNLDGKVFRFDDPPVIEERTGKRGLPGQSFGCRCYMQGVRD